MQQEGRLWIAGCHAMLLELLPVLSQEMCLQKELGCSDFGLGPFRYPPVDHAFFVEGKVTL